MFPLQRANQSVVKARTGSSPVSVSVAASLALMGDSLLYAVLAAEAPALGIPLVSVGVLLSANRFVRLVTNSLAGAVYQRFGREWPFFLAMVVAAFTTFAYGLPFGFGVFLVARLAWGTCWSFLNLGMYLSVLEHSEDHQRGQWMGRIKSISRVGTIIAVTVGAYLTDVVGFRPVVFGMGVLSLFGALVSLRDVRTARPGARGGTLRAQAVRDNGVAGQVEDSNSERATAGARRVYILHVIGFISSAP